MRRFESCRGHGPDLRHSVKVREVCPTAVMRELVLAPLATGGIFLILLGLVVPLLAVVLLAIYVVRVAVKNLPAGWVCRPSRGRVAAPLLRAPVTSAQ